MSTENGKIKRVDRHPIPSLCRDCANAIGSCSWSADFVPVKGWSADSTRVNFGIGHGRTIDSFFVKSCPMFRADEATHTKTIHDEGLVPFCLALISTGARDYARSLVKIRQCEKEGRTPPQYARILAIARQTEAWFSSPLVADMFDVCGIKATPSDIVHAIQADPDGVLKRVKQQYNTDPLGTGNGCDDEDDED